MNQCLMSATEGPDAAERCVSRMGRVRAVVLGFAGIVGLASPYAVAQRLDGDFISLEVGTYGSYQSKWITDTFEGSLSRGILSPGGVGARASAHLGTGKVRVRALGDYELSYNGNPNGDQLNSAYASASLYDVLWFSGVVPGQKAYFDIVMDGKSTPDPDLRAWGLAQAGGYAVLGAAVGEVSGPSGGTSRTIASTRADFNVGARDASCGRAGQPTCPRVPSFLRTATLELPILADHTYYFSSSATVGAGGWDLDFGNTMSIYVRLPSGVTMESASGVFLSQAGVSPIPEPGSWALTAFGLGLLGLRSCRRRSG